MDKLFITDDNHWVTINGNHVLINEEGEVQSGMGGALKGVKLSKATSAMKGGKFKTAKTEQRELIDKHNKRNDAMINRVEKIKKEGAKKDSAYTKAINRVNRLEREADKKKDFDKADRLWKLREDLEQARSDNYNANNDKWHRLASKARENTKRTEKQIGEIDKKYKKAGEALSSARGKIKSAREANAYMKERGTKISKATPEMVGGKFRNVTKETDKIGEKYNKNKERLDRGLEKIDKEYERNSRKIKDYFDAYKRLKKLDEKKYGGLMERVKNKEFQLNHEQGLLAQRADTQAERLRKEYENRTRNINKEFDKSFNREIKLKKALAKARPKIAERREAVKNFNAKKESLNNRWNDTMYRMQNMWRETPDPKERRAKTKEYEKELSEIRKEQRKYGINI